MTFPADSMVEKDHLELVDVGYVDVALGHQFGDPLDDDSI
jgi:hypothetical protein